MKPKSFCCFSIITCHQHIFPWIRNTFGTAITMSCSFNYAESFVILPLVTWNSNNEQAVTNLTSESMTSTLTIQASLPRVSAYTCTSSFGGYASPGTTPPPGNAINPPHYSYIENFMSKTILCTFTYLFVSL